MLAQNMLEARFVAHLTEHQLSFATAEEYAFRRQLFAEHDAIIVEHNSQNFSFELGHNKFSTWTDDEYKAILGGREEPEVDEADIELLPETNDVEVDWRTKGVVNDVQD